MTPMKVVYTITGLDWAGAEVQVRDLTLAMLRRGVAVEIISLSAPKAFVDELVASGAVVRSLDLTREKKTPLALARSVFALRQLLRSINPDVVHAHMVHANLLTRLALSWGSWPPLVCTAHNTHEGGALRDWAYRLTNQWSSLDTTISSAATNRFLADKVFRRCRTLTVSNGIDVSKFLPTNMPVRSGDDLFRWISVGRLHEQKDYPNLLAALQAVPNAHLDIVGQGELAFELGELVQALNLVDRVKFLGVQANLPDLLPNYDGFVLSSAWEGFGLVVAEAMASGLPVVATRSGGPQEIIGEGEEAGFLVAPRSPHELAHAMVRMAGLSAEARRGMGQAGRQRIVKHFSIAAVADQWQSIYHGLIMQRATH